MLHGYAGQRAARPRSPDRAALLRLAAGDRRRRARRGGARRAHRAGRGRRRPPARGRDRARRRRSPPARVPLGRLPRRAAAGRPVRRAHRARSPTTTAACSTRRAARSARRVRLRLDQARPERHHRHEQEGQPGHRRRAARGPRRRALPSPRDRRPRRDPERCSPTAAPTTSPTATGRRSTSRARPASRTAAPASSSSAASTCSTRRRGPSWRATERPRAGRGRSAGRLDRLPRCEPSPAAPFTFAAGRRAKFAVLAVWLVRRGDRRLLRRQARGRGAERALVVSAGQRRVGRRAEGGQAFPLGRDGAGGDRLPPAPGGLTAADRAADRRATARQLNARPPVATPRRSPAADPPRATAPPRCSFAPVAPSHGEFEDCSSRRGRTELRAVAPRPAPGLGGASVSGPGRLLGTTRSPSSDRINGTLLFAHCRGSCSMLLILIYRSPIFWGDPAADRAVRGGDRAGSHACSRRRA